MHPNARARSKTREYLQGARKAFADSHYRESLALYCNVLQWNPPIANSIETEVARLIRIYFKSLVKKGDFDIFLKMSQQVLGYYPFGCAVLYEMGRVIGGIGRYEEACSFMKRCIMVNGVHVSAEECLNVFNNNLVNRWHYRMLNDKSRNLAYRKAIHDVISSRDRVVDIGCGTGLLSFYAAETGAKILACESDKIMYDVVVKTIKENKLKKSIVPFYGDSQSLSKKENNHKFTAIVTEIFDSGLFGEHCLDAIADAWERLAVSPSEGKIIPRGATLYMCGIESETLARRYRVIKSKNNKLFSILNFDNINLFIPRDERYDTEDLTLIKDVKYVTDVRKLLTINFKNIQNLQDLQKNVLNMSYNFNITKKCKLDAYAMWFDLHLTDDITITSNPTSEHRCKAWDTAIYPRASAATFDEGDSFQLVLRWINGFIPLGVKNEKKRTALDIATTKDVVNFLNDENYINNMLETLGVSCMHLDQLFSFDNVNIIDYSSFPVIGLTLLLKGACSLTCREKSKDIIEKLAENNKINLNYITYFDKTYMSKDQKFEVLIYDFIRTIGTLKNKAITISEEYQTEMLRPGGVILPRKISMFGKLVASQYLNDFNRVFDGNLNGHVEEQCDLNIADLFIDLETQIPLKNQNESNDQIPSRIPRAYTVGMFLNPYQVTQNTFHPSLEFEKEYLSKEFCFYDDCYSKRLSTVIKIKAICNGFINAVETYFKVNCLSDTESSCTNTNTSYVNTMYYLIDPPFKVKKGQKIELLVFCDNDGSVKIVIDEDKS